MDLAIRAQGLSKQYKIGMLTRHDTLRDSLTDKMSRPFRGIAALFRPDGIGHPPTGSQLATRDSSTIWALKDVSFEVKKGETVGIIGPNGAGKSTLFKILSRVTEPSGGQAEIYGRTGTLLETGIGFHLELTGRENVYLSGAILGMRKAEIDRKFAEIVEFSGVEKFLDTPVKRYSSGMYVRLAFSVAAHLETDILLIDEVLAVGDAAFQKKCLRRMGEAAKEGRTVLLVSHNMAAIAEFCQTALLLNRGSVTAAGTTDDVIKAYLATLSKSAAAVAIEDPRIDKGVRLTRVTVCDDELKPRSELNSRLPFTLIIDFELTTYIPQLSLAVRLTNDYEINVLHSWIIFQAPYRQGRYRARGQFPGSLFAPGRYYISVAAERYELGDYHVEDYHHASRCLAFDILNTNLESHDGLAGRGIIVPRIPWHIQEQTR